MVFESLVADLLNRFLGDYVDNLDAKQLNIGIWGGDVKLHHLDIKETALDALDLPVKLKFGCLDRLILKIPWKNLYTEPVIANIEGLYLVVVPNKGVVYNETKAQKNEHENKQKSLARLEENRKNRRKPKDPSADTFTEKLIAQIIKNLQIKIKNIHVRYEDKYTDSKRPFAAGVTLESLDFETTDSDWQATIHKETLNIFYKLVHLNNLAVYWNSHTKMITDSSDRHAIRSQLERDISTRESGKNADHKYVLEPIQMEARLKLNQKPETDGSNWTIPKIDLSVDLERLALGIGRYQYQDILLFLEAQERFNLAGRYLKYRPELNEYRGHYKEWWKFAYTSILEENIRRRRHNWSWTRMRRHRHMVRDYRQAWVRKQTEKSLPSDIKELIEEAEEKLDVFNLNIARQQAELEIDRKGLTRLEDQPQGWGAWAKSWWSGSAKPKEEEHKQEGDIISQFEQAMSPEEKAKLFDAIDYQENTPPTDYPKEYVENRVKANLQAISLSVEETLELKFSNLESLLEQRPSARAISLKSSVKSLSMSGGDKPMLELLDPSMDWLRLNVETNPLKGDFDQFVALAIAPVILRYHAPAINTAAEVFKPPESVRLNQLTAAALAKYEDVKARSVTGLQHAVDTRSKLKMDIKIEPATIVISEGGIFDAQKPTLITELGLLTIQSTNKVSDDTYKDAKSEKHRELMIKAYDKFQIKLSNMQLLFGSNFEECMKAREDVKSSCHILRPTGLDIALHMSSIDDLNIPKFRIYGDLPDIVVRMSDERLLQLTRLAFSIPTPKKDESELQEINIAASVEAGRLKDRAKMHAIMEVDELDEEAVKRHVKETAASSDDEGVGDEVETEQEDEGEGAKNKELREQMVQVDINLRLNQIGLEILRGDELVLAANIRELGFQLQLRTFDMVVKSHLGSITVEMPTFRSLLEGRETLYLIDNPKEKNTEHLMEMIFVQANKESPFFVTEYKKIQQNIEFTFKTLNVTLHQEALVNLKAYGEKLSEQLKQVQEENSEKAKDFLDGTRKMSRSLSHLSLSSFTSNVSGDPSGQRKKRTTRKQKSKEELFDESVINLKVNAQVTALKLLIGSNKGSDTSLDITGTKCSVTMRQKETHVQATLDSIQMLDETPNATHRKLLAVFGKANEAMLQFDFTQTIRTDKERAHMEIGENDMAVRIRLAQLRFVFLNLWVNRMLHWINPFQEEAAIAAAQAQQLAQEKAAETAQSVRKMLEENPQRILLDVKLFAPAIVVPRRSTSHQVLLFDLGRLIVNNKFSTLRNAVIDNMTIQIKDVHAASGLLDKDSVSVSTKCNILRPLTFTLLVHRNLSFQFHKDVPELAVEAQFSLIDLSLSQQDYTVIMQTLSGNLAEGTPPRARRLTVSGQQTTTAGKVEKPTETKSQPQRMASLAVPSADIKRNVQSLQETSVLGEGGLSMDKPKVDYKKIVFQFRMDEIDMRLYEGNTGLEQGKGQIERSDRQLFSQLKLTNLKVGGWMTEQNAMDVAISLLSFTMADKREGKTKVPHLLDKKSKDAEKDLLMSLQYQQDSRGNQNVDISSSSFFLCLCPEFLGALAAFFAVPKSEEDQKLEDAALAVRTGTLGGSSGGPQLQSATKSTQGQEDATIKPPTTLTLRGRINDIEVILIENSMEPESSQALVLSFNCTADVNNQDDIQQVDGRICGLQIVSTYFTPEKRHLVNYSVLQKMDIILAGTVNTITKEQEFAVCIDSVHLKVSPSVIRLLSAVGASFSENRGSGDDTSSKRRTLREYPDYWEPKELEHGEYWWFTELGEEAVEPPGEPGVELAMEAIKNERLEFRIDSFIITIEAGVNETTMPMILWESSVLGAAENWTGKMSVDASLQFQVSYYNEAFSVWEPVVEPVQREPGKWDRWQLDAKIRSHGEDELADVGELGARATLMPKMTIDLAATKILNITVTKSFLHLLTNLGDAFEKASKQISPPKTRELPGISPYLVMNDTGLDVKIRNSETLQVSDSNEPVDARHSSFIDLKIVGDEQPIGLQPEEDCRPNELILQLLGTERIVDVHRAETRRIPLNKYADSGKQWQLVVDTEIENSRRVITLKSLVQFVNHMDIPLEIFTTANSTSMNSCGVVKPNSNIPLNIPLSLLYTATGEFFFQPTDDNYEISSDSYSWHDFDQKTRHTLRCDDSKNNRNGIYLDLIVTSEEVRGEHGRSFVDNIYTVHIYPPLQFRNLLPIDIHLIQPIDAIVKGGEDIPLNVIAGQELQFSLNHNGEDHTTTIRLKESPDDLEIVTLTSAIGYDLHLGAHWGTEYLRKECSIYAPYWTVNSTGKTISYVDSVLVPKARKFSWCTGGDSQSNSRSRRLSKSEFEITHQPDQNPTIIPYPHKQFEAKKKAYVRVEDSERSDEFPLDTVGNAGRISCKAKQDEFEYELTVDVQLCQSRLTKIVTFTAFYLLQNTSRFAIEVREQGKEEWIEVPAETCISLWPTQKSGRKLMCARYKGQSEESVYFPFTENFEEFCPTNSKHLGFYIACTVAESSSVINIDSFHPGMASALLINDTNVPIQFVQQGLPKEAGYTLQPQHQQIFTYTDLSRKERALEWSSGQHSGILPLVTDNLSSYAPNNQQTYYYWASFLNGRQRTVVFTEDVSVATIAKEAFEVERMDQQVELSLHGIGISLVNNTVGQEILYMGMSSSGIIWQQKIRARYRPFAVKIMQSLEEAHQEWIQKGRQEGFVDVGESSINFQTMIMRHKKKTKNEVKIRRSFQNGFYMMYRKSPHQTQIHIKLNHLQIDNQLPASVYPCVLAMVPPPRSVVADNEPKPFAEFSFIMNQSEHSNILQIKYLRLLVQEFDVRVDKGLVEAVLSLLDSEQISVPYTPEAFKKDMELARPKLQERVITTKASKQKSFYHDLHISPLMVHLSFSQGGTSKKHGPNSRRVVAGQAGLRFFSIFQVLMKSVGVTVTEVQDVVFKLAYFDRKHTFYNKQQLQSEIVSHYTRQFLKQLYVLVLGLEILGNPYGLVVDVVGGVQDFFYQPFQGAIQGPEEFAEGLAIGLTSIFSHSVGGITGAASKITGTVGKGIAALTLDEDYQRKRQEAINRRPQNFTEGMAQGVQGLGQGIVSGITGVVTKPLEGARQGGVGGFVGGVGRGLLGVVARPLSGAVDFTSNTFNAVKNVATNAEDLQSLRPARLIPVDQIVRPYVFNEACGYKIFRDTDKGYYADLDNFIAHAYINERNVFIVTDRRVLLSNRQSILGSWTTAWTHEFSELQRPQPAEMGVKLEFKHKKKGILGIGSSSGKGIRFSDKSVADSINEKLLNAYDNVE